MLDINQYKTWKVRKRNDFPAILDQLGYSVGAEIGVWRGEYSLNLLKNASGLKKLHLVDPWTGIGMSKPEVTPEEAYESVADALKSFDGRYEIHRMLSEEAEFYFKVGSLDFVYLDASHDFESVNEDLVMWVPKVRKGGLIFGHDYNNRGYKRVKNAVDEFFGEENVNKTEESVASWFVGRI